jgi:hypothetical protein
MLSIGALRLQLPAGFEHRAPVILHLLAYELARLPVSVERSLPGLGPLPLEIPPGATDGEVATRIATAIHEELRRSAC